MSYPSNEYEIKFYAQECVNQDTGKVFDFSYSVRIGDTTLAESSSLESAITMAWAELNEVYSEQTD